MVFVHPSSRTPRIQYSLCFALVCAIVAALAVAPHGYAQTEPPAPLVQATEPPPPPPPPPTVPPPPPPPPPTVPPPPPPTVPPPPPPTVPPPPPPPPPTEPPPRTAVPTRPPTEPPPPTSPPQQQAPPPVQPISPPATQAPDDANLDCELVDNANPLTSGSADWALYDCSLELDFGQVASIDIRGQTGTPGWRVILVDFDAPDTPGLLDASNNRLGIDDLENESAARFMLGVRLSCTAFIAAELEFEIAGVGASTADGVEAIAILPIAAEPAPIPDLTLESLAFTDTTGEIVVRYDNAPTTCGWQLLMSFGEPGSGTAATQASTLAITSVDGPEGTTASLANGAISILIPAPDAEPVSVGGAHVAISLGDGGGIEFESILVEAFTSP